MSADLEALEQGVVVINVREMVAKVTDLDTLSAVSRVVEDRRSVIKESRWQAHRRAALLYWYGDVATWRVGQRVWCHVTESESYGYGGDGFISGDEFEVVWVNDPARVHDYGDDAVHLKLVRSSGRRDPGSMTYLTVRHVWGYQIKTAVPA